MSRIIQAIYENGAFKPIYPVQFSIANGHLVTLTLDEDSSDHPDPLDLATRVYEGLSEQEIDEIEKIILDRNHFMDQEHPR